MSAAEFSTCAEIGCSNLSFDGGVCAVHRSIAKRTNPHRVKLRDRAEEEGFDSVMDYIESIGHETVMPALCDEGCEVEPDGRCSHGCPSPLLAAGLI